MSKKKITNMRALWHYSAADTGEKVFMMKKKKKNQNSSCWQERNEQRIISIFSE